MISVAPKASTASIERFFFKSVVPLVGDAAAMRPLLIEIAEIAKRSVSMNFQAGGRYDKKGDVFTGGQRKWIKSMRARIQGGITLSDTGRLASSIRYEVTGDRVLIGVNWNAPSGKSIAAALNYGAIIRPVNKPRLVFRLANGKRVSTTQVILPARPFLVLQAQDVQDITRTIVRFYIKSLRSIANN